MARHLVGQGHEVKLASYDRGYRNLKEEFDMLEIEGLVIANENNKVSKSKTLAANLGKLSAGLKTFRRLKKSLFEEFQPDVVITDFEPMTAYLAYTNDLPLMTIDNQHRMRYMQYDGPAHLNTDRRLTKGVIRAMVPRPDVSLVITFYEAPATNRRTFSFRLSYVTKSSQPNPRWATTSSFISALASTISLSSSNNFPPKPFACTATTERRRTATCTTVRSARRVYERSCLQQSRDGHGRVYPHERGALAQETHARPTDGRPVRTTAQRPLPGANGAG